MNEQSNTPWSVVQHRSRRCSNIETAKTQPSHAQTHKRGAWFNALRRQSNPMHFLVECTWFDVRNLNHQLCCIFCLSQIWTRNRMASFLRFFFFCVFSCHTLLLQNILYRRLLKMIFFYFNTLSSVYCVCYIWHGT